MKRLILALIGLQLFAAPFLSAQESEEKPSAYLLGVKGHDYRFQRIGTFTYFLCSKKDTSDDCQKIGGMDLQASVDWTELIKKAGKKSLETPSGILLSETFVDQYGGPWTIQIKVADALDKGQEFLKPFHAAVVPGFLGYKISNASNGDIASAQVLLKESEWSVAKKELGLVPAQKKKFSFGGLFR